MKKENIFKNLNCGDINLILLENVDSTNEYLKTYVKNNGFKNTVVIAESQTAGKGTKNRTFISQKGGVYLSILIKPSALGFDATAVTPMTAVAVSDAIDEISGKSTAIKWVNDVYLEVKKVSGILCESVIDSMGEMPYIIVGVGVNLFRPKDDFPPEIKDIATAVFDEFIEGVIEEFIALLINKFYDYYTEISQKTFLQKYRNLNLVLGKEIEILSDFSSSFAKAISIDDSCRLVVEMPDKTRRILSSGEVKIKL